jgi:ketosteroid isomerase-like protein
MSEENVSLIEGMHAAWERDDYPAIVDFSDPEIQIVQPAELPDARSYSGHQGVIEAFEDWPKQWDEFRVELTEVRDVDDDRVISLTCHHVKARGIGFEQDIAYLFTLKDRKCTRVEMFTSLEQALEAAGLSE